MSGSARSSLRRDSPRNMARSDQGPQSPRRAPAPTGPSDPPTAGEGEECPVCYDAVATVNLNCSHSLCTNCADRWFQMQPTCPMCREIVIMGFGSQGAATDQLQHARDLFARGAGPEEYRRMVAILQQRRGAGREEYMRMMTTLEERRAARLYNRIIERQATRLAGR